MLGTRHGCRSPRLQRYAALRALAQEWGWRVLGTTADFSESYAVPELLGARSARAELVIGGEHSGWPARVALVAARPFMTGHRHTRKRGPSLLVVVDSGPSRWQWVAEADRTGVDVAVLGPGELPKAMRKRLDDAVRRGVLRRGDHIAAGEIQLMAARTLHPATTDIQPAPQLDLLVGLLGDMGAR